MPGGLLGLQNRRGGESSLAGSIPVRLRPPTGIELSPAMESKGGLSAVNDLPIPDNRLLILGEMSGEMDG